MAEQLLFEMLVIVVAAFVIVTALVCVRFSPVTGYLLAGILIGERSGRHHASCKAEHRVLSLWRDPLDQEQRQRPKASGGTGSRTRGNTHENV